MDICLNWRSEELQKLAEQVGVQATPAFADKVGVLMEQLGLDKNTTVSEEDIDKINDDIDKLNNRIISLESQLNLYEAGSEQYNVINVDLNKSKSELSELENKLTQQQLPTAGVKINIYAGTKENIELSNFAIRPFTTNVETVSGEKQYTFQSVEQGFHFYKAVVANNAQIAKQVLATTNGGQLKKLTNRSNLKMTSEQVKEWDDTSKSIMLNLMYDSYAQNPKAAEKLLATGNAKITHTQDNTRWKTDFPEVVMTVRDMLREEGFSTQSQIITQQNQPQLPSPQQVKDYLEKNKPVKPVTTTIKPGVAELFESNPKLANAVYEALGLRQESGLSEKNIFTVEPIQSVDKKAKAKAKIATQYIGFAEGIIGSSTALYAQQAGKVANTGNYSSSDAIFVSVGGKRGNETVRKAQQDKTIKEAIKALEAGATLITDNAAYVESNSYNEGEKRLAANLKAKGYNYSETIVDGNVLGVWNRGINQLTPQQKQQAQLAYSQYLDTVFPDSKIKNIVYHGSKNKFDIFDKSKQESPGFYFTPDITSSYFGKNDIIYHVILNSNNPISDYSAIYKIAEEGTLDAFIKRGYDGIIELQDKKEIIVFESEQIHILSSKKDLEMFRNFVNFTKSEYAKYGDIQQFRDYIMSKNFAAIEEFLVVNNKIDRKC